jgi:hypothetical protein
LYISYIYDTQQDAHYEDFKKNLDEELDCPYFLETKTGYWDGKNGTGVM